MKAFALTGAWAVDAGRWAPALAWLATVLGVLAGHGVLRKRWRLTVNAYTSSTGHRLGDLFLFISPVRLWRIGLAFSAGLGVLAWWIWRSPWPALAIAVVAIRLPTLCIAHLRARRVRRLEAQLPDAARAMAGALRAGASLSAVLNYVAATACPPLAQELTLVTREQRVGVSFNEAMERFERRVSCEGVTLLSATLRVAAQTGGNLGAMLDNVADTVQRRSQVEARMRTLTAQGRLQAVIVGVLPAALLAVLSALSPEDMAPLWHTPRGWVVLAILAGMELSGFLMIRRVVRVDL